MGALAEFSSSPKLVQANSCKGIMLLIDPHPLNTFPFCLLNLNSTRNSTYKDKRKTTVPCRLTSTARVLQERMKYPNRAHWAMPTAKKRPPIDPDSGKRDLLLERYHLQIIATPVPQPIPPL